MDGPTPRLAEPGAGQSTTPVCARARSVARALARLSRARVDVAATTTPWSSSTRRAISSRTGSSGVPASRSASSTRTARSGWARRSATRRSRSASPYSVTRVTGWPHCAQRGRDGVQRRAPPRPRRPDDEDPPVATGDVEADGLEVAVPDPDGQETADGVELHPERSGRWSAGGAPAAAIRLFASDAPSGVACVSAGHRVQRLVTYRELMRRVPTTEPCDLDLPVRPGVHSASWRLVGGHHPRWDPGDRQVDRVAQRENQPLGEQRDELTGEDRPPSGDDGTQPGSACALERRSHVRGQGPVRMGSEPLPSVDEQHRSGFRLRARAGQVSEAFDDQAHVIGVVDIRHGRDVRKRRERGQLGRADRIQMQLARRPASGQLCGDQQARPWSDRSVRRRRSRGDRWRGPTTTGSESGRPDRPPSPTGRAPSRRPRPSPATTRRARPATGRATASADPGCRVTEPPRAWRRRCGRDPIGRGSPAQPWSPAEAPPTLRPSWVPASPSGGPLRGVRR